jgi:GR25 family glycosyltransferase involved in LPS biosynthesis
MLHELSMQMPFVEKAYVLNLKRRKDRLLEFRERFPYSYEDVIRIEAIDGHNLPEHSQHFFKGALNPFEKACFLTHLKTWQHIVKHCSHNTFILIFEDDVHFIPEFTSIWENQIGKMISSIDINQTLYIGGRFDPQYKINTSEIKTIHNQYLFEFDGDRTLHAYIISTEIAKTYIHMFRTTYPHSKPVDKWVLQLHDDKLLPPLSLFNLLCYSPRNYKSDIQI